MKFHLRLVLFTEAGNIAGFRLQRGTPLPVDSFNFPDTEEGRAAAERAVKAMEDYMKKPESPPAKRKRTR